MSSLSIIGNEDQKILGKISDKGKMFPYLRKSRDESLAILTIVETSRKFHISEYSKNFLHQYSPKVTQMPKTRPGEKSI